MGDSVIQTFRRYKQELRNDQSRIISMHATNKNVAGSIAQLCCMSNSVNLLSTERQAVMDTVTSHARQLIECEMRLGAWEIAVKRYLDSNHGIDIMIAFDNSFTSLTQTDAGNLSVENHWMVQEVTSILGGEIV